MDILNVILLLVIVIIIVSNKTSLNQKFNDLELRIMELQNLLKRREQEAKAAEKPKEISIVQESVKPPVEVKLPEPPKPLEIKPEPVIERQKEAIADSMAAIRRPVRTREQPVTEPEEPSLSFFERYPDLEKFIGENLVNKIGIAILVLAIGFFVKYAIDNDWVGPVGRVGIGVVCGGILIGFAHRMRNSYKAFSSVLVGGGLAIFYFTITLAYQEFHLFNQTTALIILIVITIFAVILSLLYDKQELAVIALIGGFASPFMVSNGTNNYNGLFIYLLILNIGLLIIAYYKAWRILNISAFALSVLVFATVLFTLTAPTYVIGFRFATVFYLLFFTINIINNVRENKKFLAVDFTILLTNTALYFAAGLYLLTVMHQEQYRGLFSAGLGALNLVLSYILFRNRKVDPNILYLLIGITLTFISLTAPIQLHGNNITLFWASETVLLYWLYLKSDIKLMKLTSLLIWMAMFISLFMDLVAVYSNADLHIAILVNKGFITTLFAATSTYLLYVLVKKDLLPQIYGIAIAKDLYRVVAIVLLFASGLLELNHQFEFYYPHTGTNILYLMVYVPVFVYVFNVISAKVNNARFNGQLGMYLMAFTIVIYLALSPVFFDVVRDMLENKKIAVSHFAAHAVSAIFIGLIFYPFIRLCQERLDEDMKNSASWIISSAIVLFLSLEICLISELLFYSRANSIDLIQTVYIKTGLPVLWGILSFILMWMGMRNKQRTLRIISLSLFLITLIKLFMFDINNIPVAGKIAAFFCLGILLLIISFMYQKVKKIIVDDEAKPKE
ncbi:DUF2339 domain-containing protein [Mucilaginibacter sp. OK098]|uniref:DUF2339 domain-containing protein n=1 Tax=Mucilaginibacter sp. OK098 TaxID=1855297 RepID=UPI00092196F9|nr:DUF2339 domain-containing protein [Mucilaginibacter sp. OK098]SHN31786.1 Predicted membrane protein [Mucilaginibacter sp. OK098]